jgi:predicted CXXCH cytochrome family protein
MRRNGILWGGVVAIAAVVLAIFMNIAMNVVPDSTSHAAPTFVGSARCADCHADEHTTWQGSQHAKAMQHASVQTILANFDNSTFRYAGVTTTFFRRDDRFFVRTDGPDGSLQDFEVKYTFGVEPLQQYLVELPGGRLQALSISWDTRAREQGGQRWFHLYPTERIDHRDELHWTQPAQNWNVMCADCHSTNIRKNFDVESLTFATTWSDLAVGCEACHGPGSSHAQSPNVSYRVGVGEDRAAAEMQTCAACHSRRAQFSEGAKAGDALLDHYLPAMLSEGLYHPDGHQQGEVFVWGSFLQSSKYAAGVTCAACHDPHSQKLKKSGNETCTQCHAAVEFDTPKHHHHEANTSQCVNCHMREETYMVIDTRRDHGFHVPRPDLTARLGVPNACNDCHADRDAQWADNVMQRWYGEAYRERPQFAAALHAGRRDEAGAVSKLLGLLDDPRQPAIVRASAIELLARHPGDVPTATVRRQLADTDSLVRYQALLAQAELPLERRASLLSPMLGDTTRAVRHEASKQLIPVRESLSESDRARLDAEINDLERALSHDLSQAESWLNLSELQLARGERAAAEQSLRRAIVIEPRFIPAYANLADLLRASGRESDAEAVIRGGLQRNASAPALHEALGFSLVRQGRKSEALAEFAAAYRAAPDETRFRYVYALSLDDAGRRAEAKRLLERGLQRRFHRESLVILAAWATQESDRLAAERAYARLREVNPSDPALPAGFGR